MQRVADTLRDWVLDGGEMLPPPAAGVR
jgi:hypothetical protein